MNKQGKSHGAPPFTAEEEKIIRGEVKPILAWGGVETTKLVGTGTQQPTSVQPAMTEKQKRMLLHKKQQQLKAQ
mgnify:CR=1 FL=1